VNAYINFYYINTVAERLSATAVRWCRRTAESWHVNATVSKDSTDNVTEGWNGRQSTSVIDPILSVIAQSGNIGGLYIQ